MHNLRVALATVVRISLPYFRSEDRWRGLTLLAAVIALQLFSVWLDVRYSQWNNDFYTALQKKDWPVFAYQMFVVFSWIAALTILSGVYQTYLSQWLQIRWRTWQTNHYADRWMANGVHYRMRIAGNPADNPDQRIAEDTDRFTSSTLSIGVAIIGQIVSLFSFLFILWELSADKPLIIFGQDYNIPGYLVWTALIYAVIGTFLAHRVGKPLVRLNYLLQRYEADYRFSLVRLRENAEEVALLHGEPAERTVLKSRFAAVMENFYQVMRRTKYLNFFQSGYAQLAIIFPFIVVTPLYFAGTMELGDLTQTAYAFGMVRAALSFFVSAYDTLATWKSVVDRLDGFEQSLEAAETQGAAGPSFVDEAGRHDLAIDDLAVSLPDGREIATVPSLDLAPGDQALIMGASGSGKTTLFRALSGVWPFASGTVRKPARSTIMIQPQKSYLPLGTLRSALTYPDATGIPAEAVETALKDVGLGRLVPELDAEHNWQNRLSGGEQQRIGIARAILHKPDWLFLDEATASLDQKAEGELYRLMQARLPETAIVSIGHRSSLTGYHRRFLNLISEPGRPSVLIAAAGPEPATAPA